MTPVFRPSAVLASSGCVPASPGLFICLSGFPYLYVHLSVIFAPYQGGWPGGAAAWPVTI